MARILYISHDIAEPSGGVGIQYDHVATLRIYGFDAYIVHRTKGFRYPFGLAEVPVLDASDGLNVLDTDILVVPEDHMPAIRGFRDVACRKILFCQNHFYFFSGLDPGEAWADFGFSDFLCLSEPIQKAMQKWFGVAGTVIRPVIDASYFSDKPRLPGVPSVACMPRKGAANLRLVQGLIGAKHPGKAPPMTWILIDKLPRGDVATRLSESHIYVSTGHREGLGLPPLEAMAAGCLVVGFAAGGGLDYATPENGIWVQDENPWALAEALLAAVAGLGDPGASRALESKRLAGQKTAQAYSRSGFELALTTFWANRVKD